MSRRDVIYLAVTVLVVAAVFCIPAPDHNRRAGFDAQRQSTPPDTRYAINTATTTSSTTTTTTTAPDPEPQAAAPPAPQPTSQPVAAPADIAGGCDDVAWVIPVAYVWRESHCQFDAISAGGQYVGAYQFDVRHWIPAENGGWGGCADLGDWHQPDAQHECAWRLSHGGTRFTPWGG